MALGEMATETVRATEVGCSYGQYLIENIVAIRARYRDQRDHAIGAKTRHPGRFIQEALDAAEESRRESEERLGDADYFESGLKDCDNCHGDPSKAELSQGICPVARIAIYRMTLPGARKLGVD